MEILEILVVAGDACNCFAMLVSLFADGTAAYSGVKTYQGRKKAKRALQEDPQTQLKPPSWVPFLILLAIALFFTIVLFASWYRNASR